MVVHIRGNHTLLRLHGNHPIKNLSACFHISNLCKDHPYLVCIVDLTLFSAYKKSCFLIIEIFPGSLCFQTDLLRHFLCLSCISKNLCDLLNTFCTVDVNTLDTTLFIQSLCPVDKSPEAFLIFQDMLLIKLLCCNFHLTICTFAQILQSFHIAGCLIIIIKCCSEEHGIIQKECIICDHFRFCKQAGTYLTIVLSLSCKKIQTAFYKVIVFEGFIVCQCLQS